LKEKVVRQLSRGAVANNSGEGHRLETIHRGGGLFALERLQYSKFAPRISSIAVKTSAEGLLVCSAEGA